MKNIIGTFIIVMFSITLAHAGGVQSDNSGNEGYIFVATGENHGKDSIGVWTDPSTLGLQGEKGDKGDQGEQGIQGFAGRDGIDGINGLDGAQGLQGEKGDTGSQGIAGVDGKDGINGVDGKNGLDGKDGAVGPAGENGKDGLNGSDGKNGEQGVKGDKGDQGVKGNTGAEGVKGKDVDPAKVKAQDDKINELNNKVHELEEPQAILGLAVRVYDSRKWTVTAFVDYATERANVDRYGVRATYKVGRSYEEKRLDELEAKIDKLNNTPEVAKAEYYTQGSAIGYRARF